MGAMHHSSNRNDKVTSHGPDETTTLTHDETASHGHGHTGHWSHPIFAPYFHRLNNLSMMHAVKIHSKHAKSARVPIPTPPASYLLARVDSVALNPTDWKHITDSMAAPNGTAGCDFAGTVVTPPTGATKSFKAGDRIAAVTHGANFDDPQDGCFAEYAVVKADLAMKLPESLSFEKAATLPLGLSTVAQGMFQKGLQLRFPSVDGEPNNGESVLVYGGSTATGSLSIQFARLAGYTVLTTCGKRSEAFVKDLGADAAFDYTDSGVGSTIREKTEDKLKLVWDCIGSAQSRAICAAALSSDDAGCRYATTNTAVDAIEGRPGVKATHIFMYTIFNREFHKNGVRFPASVEDFEFACKFFELAQRLLEQGRLKPHPETVRPGGLQGVLQGLKDLQDGKIRGAKAVYKVADAPKDAAGEIEL